VAKYDPCGIRLTHRLVGPQGGTVSPRIAHAGRRIRQL
jgi:hypothetical protein